MIENKISMALAGGFSWLEHHPKHQKVASLISSQGTYLGCGLSPHWGACTGGNRLMVLSRLSLSVSLSLSSNQTITYPPVG